MNNIVIHISVDGLNPSFINNMPGFQILQNEGVFTHNARTDPNYTTTLPNHFCMFTGRGVNDTLGMKGHNATHNIHIDNFNIHANNYVGTIFDEVKKNGGGTNLYVGKEKFKNVDNNYNEHSGYKTSDGIDEVNKIVIDGSVTSHILNTNQDYLKSRDNSPYLVITNSLIKDLVGKTNYNFIHFKGTDIIGHEKGWGSAEYKQELTYIDHDIKYIIDNVRGFKNKVYIVLVSDHGGIEGSNDHSDNTNPHNFTIPFYVWCNKGMNKTKGWDLYAYNTLRVSPPNINPMYTLDNNEPIRLIDCANLCTTLLGFGNVRGSWLNNTIKIP